MSLSDYAISISEDYLRFQNASPGALQFDTQIMETFSQHLNLNREIQVEFLAEFLNFKNII